MKQIPRILSVSLFEVIAYGFLATCIFFLIGLSILDHDSYMQLYFDSLRNTSTLAQDYEAISAQINSNEYVANGTIFIVWSIVGLLLYYLVYFFFISERNLELFFHTLFTKGVDKIDLLEHAFARVGVRTLATIGLLIEAVLFVQILLPYLIANLNVAEFEHIFTSNGTPLLWMMIGLFAYLHVGAILLRCLTLRVRTFF